MVYHTTVYKRSYSLLNILFKIMDNVPKKWRYSLWDRTLNSAMNLQVYIIDIYNSSDLVKKLHFLDEALVEYQKLNMYLRLCNENAIISIQKQANIAEVMLDISKQLNSWKNSINKKIV